MLVEVGRCDERLAGHAPVAGVVAEAQADAVGFRETPAEVAAERAVEEAIVRSLPGSFKIGRRGRVIKTANQRSEERRVGKEGKRRGRRGRYQKRKRVGRAAGQGE